MKPSNLRSVNLWLLVYILSLAAAGCHTAPGKSGPEPETLRPEQVLDFKTLYNQNCSACHGVNGTNAAAISLNNPVYLATAGAANIERITAAGVPGTAMPPFGKAQGGMLTAQQIAILAEGMEQNWGSPFATAGPSAPAYASSTPGNPGQGQKDFVAYCANCHGPDGTGGKTPNGILAGSLVDPSYLALISDQGLRSIVIAGQLEQGMPPWLLHRDGTVADPSADKEISDLLAGRVEQGVPLHPHPLTNQEVTDTVAWLASHRVAAPGQVYQQHP
jgi:cytochrome c oxidase cbb3-type subunit 3/ubiquinol-cytochrome c reductase cytochrome c subunit